MYTSVEHLKVAVAGGFHVAHVKTTLVHLLHQRGEVGHLFAGHVGAFFQVLVAQCGQTCIIDHTLDAEPPLAQQGGNERGNQTTDVDEYVENLETRIAAILDRLDLFLGLALGNSIGLHVVVHLTHDSLQVTLEQAITEGDQEQGHAGEHEQPHVIAGRMYNGDCQKHITNGHDHETPLDSTFVILGAVGNETAD